MVLCPRRSTWHMSYGLIRRAPTSGYVAAPHAAWGGLKPLSKHAYHYLSKGSNPCTHISCANNRSSRKKYGGSRVLHQHGGPNLGNFCVLLFARRRSWFVSVKGRIMRSTLWYYWYLGFRYPIKDENQITIYLKDKLWIKCTYSQNRRGDPINRLVSGSRFLVQQMCLKVLYMHHIWTR